MPRRFAEGFLVLSVGITLAELVGDRGGGNYFFTLVWLVLVGAAAPYLVSFAVMRRTPARVSLAVGWAVVAYGAIDAAVRMQAFFFPTERSNGGMALWLPIYAVGFIPFFTLLAYTFVSVAGPDT